MSADGLVCAKSRNERTSGGQAGRRAVDQVPGNNKHESVCSLLTRVHRLATITDDADHRPPLSSNRVYPRSCCDPAYTNKVPNGAMYCPRK